VECLPTFSKASTMNRPRNILDEILDRSNFSSVTKQHYGNVIGAWIEFAGPNPQGWTRLAAQRFYEAALSRGIKIKSANDYLDCLRYVSRWYHTQYGGEDFAIVQTMQAPHQRAHRRALQPEEVLALLQTCDGALPIAKRPIDRRDRTLLIVGVETGMRAKSLRGLDIDKIHRSGSYPYVNVPVKGPGGTGTFDVPLSDTALLAIDDLAGWMRSQGAKRGPLFRGFRPALSERGQRGYIVAEEPIALISIHRILRVRSQAAGIAHAHPHLMRHTFITSRALAGLTPIQIASITGHHVEARRALGGEHEDPGRMAGYYDLKPIAETARQSTPPWLADHVRRFIGG
jgi:integrase